MDDSQQQQSGNQTGQKFTQTVNRLKSELDRLVDMAWSRGEEVWGQIRNPDSAGDWSPEIDLVETEETVVVFVNLPGIPADQVELTLVGNTLELTAYLDRLTLQTSDRVHKRERPAGRVHRLIMLPVSVDNESAVAHAEAGVLKVEMKKAVNMRAHKVPVVVSSGAPTPPEM